MGSRNDGTGRRPTGRFRKSTTVKWWRTERDETGKFPSSRTNPRTPVNHGLSSSANSSSPSGPRSARSCSSGEPQRTSRNAALSCCRSWLRCRSHLRFSKWELRQGSASIRTGTATSSMTSFASIPCRDREPRCFDAPHQGPFLSHTPAGDRVAGRNRPQPLGCRQRGSDALARNFGVAGAGRSKGPPEGSGIHGSTGSSQPHRRGSPLVARRDRCIGT